MTRAYRLAVVDDRTQQQKSTHYMAVVAFDKALTQFSRSGGRSRAAWVLNSTLPGLDMRLRDLQCRIELRKDMKYVNVVDLRTYRPPRGTSHFHIYVVPDYQE